MNEPMEYTEFHPTMELKPWIAAHWNFSADKSIDEIDHWIPPNGGVMLAILQDGTAILSGPRTEPFQVKVQGGTRIWGSMFWPGAATSLTGVDIESLLATRLPVQFAIDPSTATNKHAEWARDLGKLSALFQSPQEILTGLNDSLGSLVADATPLDDKVMHAVFQVLQANGSIEVSKLAELVELSARQLRRRFRRATGLAPKELVRIQRLRSSAVEAVMLEDISWINLAASRGYSDQAHLIREFQELMGISPGNFKQHFQKISHSQLIR